MQPTGTVWTTLIGDHPGIIPVKFGQNPISGFRKDVIDISRTLKDHKSSLSTLCSGELKIACFLINAVEIAKMFVIFSFFRLCLLHMTKVCEDSHFVKIFEIFFVQRHTCTSVHLRKKRYETGDFDKNRFNFYIKFILLIDTWHIIFIFSKWLPLVWTFRI